MISNSPSQEELGGEHIFALYLVRKIWSQFRKASSNQIVKVFYTCEGGGGCLVRLSGSNRWCISIKISSSWQYNASVKSAKQKLLSQAGP